MKGRSCAVSNIVVSPILKRNRFNINQVIIYKINNILKRLFGWNDFFYICSDFVNENYLWKYGIHLTSEESSFLLNDFINYLNGNVNRRISLMTKGCIIENNTDIKENHVHFSNKRCLISQKLISNSNSLSKSNTVHCRAKKKTEWTI